MSYFWNPLWLHFDSKYILKAGFWFWFEITFMWWFGFGFQITLSRILLITAYRLSRFNQWFTSTLRVYISSVRHAKNIWKCTRSALDWSSFSSFFPRSRVIFTSTFLQSQPVHLPISSLKMSNLRLSLSDNSSMASPHSVPLPLHLLPFLPSGLPVNLKS